MVTTDHSHEYSRAEVTKVTPRSKARMGCRSTFSKSTKWLSNHTQEDEEPQLRVGNRVRSGKKTTTKNSLNFDLMTHQNGQCTTHLRFISCGPLWPDTSGMALSTHHLKCREPPFLANSEGYLSWTETTHGTWVAWGGGGESFTSMKNKTDPSTDLEKGKPLLVSFKLQLLVFLQSVSTAQPQ